jgi:hypothetical protein
MGCVDRAKCTINSISAYISQGEGGIEANKVLLSNIYSVAKMQMQSGIPYTQIALLVLDVPRSSCGIWLLSEVKSY